MISLDLEKKSNSTVLDSKEQSELYSITDCISKRERVFNSKETQNLTKYKYIPMKCVFYYLHQEQQEMQKGYVFHKKYLLKHNINIWNCKSKKK